MKHAAKHRFSKNHSPAQATTSEPQHNAYKTNHSAVRKARRFCLQGLYEWLMTDWRFKRLGKNDWLGGNSPDAIAVRTRASNAMHTVHLGYYHTLMQNIPKQLTEFNLLIQPVLDRDIARLSPIEYAVLLIGVYELKYSPHIPYKVVIDEAIELNAHFGAMDDFRLINAVLDKLAKQLRQYEISGTDAPKDDLPDLS